MFDRLFGLRHDAVVSRHHQNHDVGCLSATGTHGGKRLVARGVEERDHAARGFHVVGANVLGNATGFARCHFGAADVVQQRGFTVVHVAHDGYHRSARQRLKLGLRHVVVGKGFWIVQGCNHRFVAQLFHQNHGGVLVQRLVDRDHLAELHQLLDHLRGFHRHLVGEFSHRDGFGHVHFKHACFHRCGLRVVVTVAVIATAATGAGAPVGRATCARTRVATGFKFFLFGRVARPAAGELGRFDLFASACTGCASRGTGRFCHGRTGSGLVQRTFDRALGVDSRLGWLGLFQRHGHFIGRGHHQANGSSFGLGLAAAVTQLGCALGFFGGSGFGCARGGGQGLVARLGRGLGSDLCAVSGLGLRSVNRSGGRSH